MVIDYALIFFFSEVVDKDLIYTLFASVFVFTLVYVMYKIST